MSLLLDALKKAAQEKLEKKSQTSDANDATELDISATQLDADPTEIEQPANTLNNDLIDQESSDENPDTRTVLETYNSLDTEGTDSDAELELADQEITEIDKQANISNAAPTEIDIPDLTISEVTQANTEIDNNSTSATPVNPETELELEPLKESNTAYTESPDIEGESTTQFNRYKANVLASELQDFLSPDTQSSITTSTDTDLENFTTESAHDEDATQFGNNIKAENVSLTQNWSEQQTGYVATPHQAEQLFANKAFGKTNRKRMFALLSLLFIAFIFIAGVYGYSYISTLNENSVVINRPSRPAQPADLTQKIIEPGEDAIDPALLIEQEDYSSILENNFTDSEIIEAKQPNQSQTRTTKSAFAATPPSANAEDQKTNIQGGLSIRKTKPSESLQDIILRGYNAYNNGNIKESKTAYLKALTLSATNRDTLLGLAAISIAQRDLKGAYNYYDKLLELNPKDDLAIAGLAGITQNNSHTTENPNNEESRIKLLLAEMPDSAHLHFTLGNFFAEKKRWSDAQQAYFDAFRLGPDNPDYAFNLAISLDHLGQASVARRFYRQALSLATTQNTNFNREAAAARVAALETE